MILCKFSANFQYLLFYLFNNLQQFSQVLQFDLCLVRTCTVFCTQNRLCDGDQTASSGIYNACSTVGWNEGTSFPIQSGHGCIGCSEDGFWDKGSFYDRLTNINQFGIEANADKVGGTAAAVVGLGIAAHAGLTALKRAKQADVKQPGAEQ